MLCKSAREIRYTSISDDKKAGHIPSSLHTFSILLKTMNTFFNLKNTKNCLFFAIIGQSIVVNISIVTDKQREKGKISVV